MALNNYITQVQRLLHDPQATFYSTTDLTAFINLARRQIAAKSKSVRLLLPSTNGIASVAVTAAGNNYVGVPTISFTGTGTGATAHATMNGQTVATIVVDTAGTGYDNTTVVVITPTNGGSGATATATINCWNTVTGQEVYTFAAANVFAQLTSGVSGILGVESIAVSWGAMKPMLKHWVWSDFQAYLRSNNTGLQSWPTVWSSYLMGAGGSVYVYPLPSQIMQWDWDCWCTVADLTNDTDPEALQYPWTDIVQYYASYLAYSNSQREKDAARMLALYDMHMKLGRSNVEPEFVPDPYENIFYG